MGKDLVLVVDDELDNRVMMRYFLESWGYEVELAANGQEALEKVASKPPNLVLLDLEMPVMNGFDCCDRLKSDPATEDIPIIMFTGLEQTTDKVKGIRKGADDYVVKTVDPEELQARIEMILVRSKRYEASAAERQPDSSADPEHAVSGSLSELYFPEAMQLILAYGKSGVLHLKDGDIEGQVYLKQGQIIHAELGTAEGEEAFYKLALWNKGHFRFQVGEPSPRETINKSGTNLLIEATRRLDEWNMISSKIPSFDVVAKLVPLDGAASIRLTGNDWKILRQVDGQRSVRQIAKELGTDLFETGRLLCNLITVGVVAVETGEKKQAPATWSNIVPQLEPELKENGSFDVPASHWKLISLIDGKRNIKTLAEMVDCAPAELVKTLKELAGQGLVRITQNNRAGVKRAQKGPTRVTKQQQAPVENKVAKFQPRIRAIGFD
jgi:CheY-like chemotaxis protein/predicted transcriptional regulator